MWKLAFAVAALTLAQGPARAALVDPGAFTPDAVIGFDGDLDTVNPSYTVGGVTVSFGGHFAGQVLDGNFPEAPVDPNTASGPLALAGEARVFDDTDFASAPALTGDTNGNTQFSPVAVLFGSPMAAVSLVAGFLDDPGDVTVVAFAADGTSLGSVVSTATGFQTFRLAGSGGALISGVLVFPTVGAFFPNFSIDDIGFRTPTIGVPAPGGLALLLLPLATLALVRRERARA